MIIYIGSKNPTKIKAVENIFSEFEVKAVEAASNVSPQPFTDQETLIGAVNRAKECAAKAEGVIGIGLEGGVMKLGEKMLLCNWGALVDETGEVYVASGARIPLPREITEQLEAGKELGEVMDLFTKKTNVRKHEGAIGIFTKGYVGREAMFTHVMELLRGQYEFNKKV
ncbi:DUF84 family protein [Aquibacillus koreensis]|uniref:inosine/xanthosine triphosphatase n=1 Tax=Aquibacillus koreensis TaxID=279446 RepID=A0A9X3WIP8_9BACI|nr:DUF84 family protein [Aquibacillus koreensis]MCT2535026.1 DUF84 family protein [Aquibacillus koreensis]MDC3419313.1 DUF84 family protein [Aquibacillus koreensis]